jgi:hypothetical protein
MSDLIGQVKLYGLALAYMKSQTPELRLRAVRETSFALRYIKNQTPEICLEAVRENGNASLDIRIFKREEVKKGNYKEICLYY